VAGGFLTKWTAPVFFYLTVVPVLWRRGRLRLLLGRAHVLGFCLAGVLCLAWLAAAASQAGWHALYDTVLREALQRLSPRHHPRPYPWGEILSFPLLVLAGTLPWSAIALITLQPAFARACDERGRRLLHVLHAWLLVNLLFWALVPGHRPRHCLPLQPAIAALAALVWIAWLEGRWRWPVRWCRPFPVLIGVLALFAVAKAGFVHWPTNRHESLRPQAAVLSAWVPRGQPLVIFRLKDEGLLFYFGGETRRLSGPEALVDADQPAYCLLTAREWTTWPGDRRADELAWLHDGQGEPLVLVRLANPKADAPRSP
jgi:4-amino-4-deoxy-L-arabinose transferase-like glycosyltransferase